MVDIGKQIRDMQQGLDYLREVEGEKMAQYQSECALYGDAGVGQHPSLWLPELHASIAKVEAELQALIESPEGLAWQANVAPAQEAEAGSRH